MRTEKHPAITYPVEDRERHRCKAEILLDGKLYRCSRGHHIDGIHDANTRAADGGLVRW